MQLTIRVELEPEPAGEYCCHCRAISVTVDGVNQETYNSVPTATELPKEEKPVTPEEEKEEVKEEEEKGEEKEEKEEEKKEEDYAEGEKDTKP